MPIEVKKDPYVWGAFALVVAIAAGFVFHGDMTTREWLALITGGAVLPALIGRSKPKPPDDPGAGQTPVLVEEESVIQTKTQTSFPPTASRPIFSAAIAICLFGSACTQGQALNAAELIFQKVQCAIAHADMPNDKIIQVCAIQPGDAEKILAIVGEHRTIAAAEANAAVEREKEAASRREKAGCSGYRDGGK